MQAIQRRHDERLNLITANKLPGLRPRSAGAAAERPREKRRSEKCHLFKVCGYCRLNKQVNSGEELEDASCAGGKIQEVGSDSDWHPWQNRQGEAD